jgi:hypothetical protein
MSIFMIRLTLAIGTRVATTCCEGKGDASKRDEKGRREEKEAEGEKRGRE